MADYKRGCYGAPWAAMIGASSLTNQVLNAAGQKIAYICQADDAITIHTLMYRQGVKTGSGGTYKVGVQGVGTDGNPDGTYATGVGGEASASLTLGTDGNILKQALDHDLTVTRGQLMAVVVECLTGDGSNNTSFSTVTNGGSSRGAPYTTVYATGAWVKGSSLPIFGYASTGKVYGHPIQGSGSTAVGAGEIGFSFTIPNTFAASYKLLGIDAYLRWQTAASSAAITLYDTNGTSVLQQVTLDSDYAGSTGGLLLELLFDEATLSALTAGSTYYVAISRGAADSATLNVYWLQVATAADWDAFGGGQDFAYVSRAGVGSGAWTTDATKRAQVQLILSDWTLAAAGGIIRNNMSGGMVL